MPISSGILENPKSDRIRHVAELASRHARRKIGRFLVEGPQAVREAVRFMPGSVHDLYVSAALFDKRDSAASVIAYAADRAGIYVHACTGAVMERISPDCQGIAAVMDCDAVDLKTTAAIDRAIAASAPGASSDGASSQTREAGRPVPLIAACWQVRDPGNAGTIIRAADAAGCAGVLLVDDCVDVTNPKVVRATAGSLFHLPVARLDVDGFFGWAANRGVHVTAADVYGTARRRPIPLPDMLEGRGDTPAEALDRPHVILFGNEARGLEEGTVDRCDDVVTIPIYGQAESLNVATSAAVLLYAFALRARR
ncbi:TrmH family RNA methyltransferase [Pseudoscardovia radai]|uniref:TrmH family RNA methyltransferase n=1 Tax=Pseudoscardovia radai TaxID=987066 RepID=UPI00399563AD